MRSCFGTLTRSDLALKLASTSKWLGTLPRSGLIGGCLRKSSGRSPIRSCWVLMELHGGGGGESWWRLVFARDRAAPRGDSISASYNAHLVATVARSTVRIFQPGYLHPQVAQGTWKKLSKISCGRLMKFQTNQINWSLPPPHSPIYAILWNAQKIGEKFKKLLCRFLKHIVQIKFQGNFNCVNIRTHFIRTMIF